MNILGLIPARGGSKAIPRKNIAPLGGRPLIAWTIEAARAARSLGRIIVSTDDADIAAAARGEGAEVLIRPSEFATDDAGALPVIRHAVEALDAQGWRADVIVYLQPTSPFRGADAIERAVALLRDGGCDTAVSVTRVPHAMTPDALMRPAGDLLEFAAPPERRRFRRQDKPMLYARNGPAVLALKRATVLAGELYGPRIKAVEMSALESHDIDEPHDLAVAQALLPLVLAARKGTGA